jgi:hypothetical protein
MSTSDRDLGGGAASDRDVQHGRGDREERKRQTDEPTAPPNGGELHPMQD